MAFGTGTVGAFGGAVKDIFQGFAFEASADGKRLEAQNYDRASAFAEDNADFTRTSTAVKLYQTQRSIDKAVGGAEADIAASGFTESGSALDILRDSISQGAITKALASQQGEITEAGYEEQAKAYKLMAESSRLAADALDDAATGAYIGAGFKALGGITSLFTG
jgi:hypothetical protein